MKSKNKYKLKPKYTTGTQGIEQKMYTPEEMKARQLAGTGASEKGVNKGIETVAGAIPVANAFMAVGKAGYGGVRQEDAYGVAKSDTGAAIATTFAPHKTTFKELEDGNIGNAVGSLILPFGFAAKQNERLRGERDELIRKQNAENNKLAFQGEDDTMAQTGQVYKTGTKYVKTTKDVEAEGGELVFKKIGSKYKLKADIKGPAHKNGGVDITVEGGDVIVPKKDAKKVREMVGKNGVANNKFNGYRLSLPKDKPVASRGGDYTGLYDENPYADMATNVYGNGSSLLAPKGGMAVGGVTQQLNIKPQATSTAPSIAPPVEETGGGFAANAGGYLNTAAQLAPTLFNIGEGLFGKPVVEKPNYVNPTLYKYQDSSDPLRRQSETAYRIDASNARNLAGGNAGNIRANLNQANVANYNRKQDINAAEVDRALQTANANTGLKNQYQLLNRDEKNRVATNNLANKAVKKEYLATGLNSLANYAQARKDDEAQNEQNDILASTLEKRNYKYNKKQKQYKLKK
jgi:hypothetical protein